MILFLLATIPVALFILAIVFRRIDPHGDGGFIFCILGIVPAFIWLVCFAIIIGDSIYTFHLIEEYRAGVSLDIPRQIPELPLGFFKEKRLFYINRKIAYLKALNWWCWWALNPPEDSRRIEPQGRPAGE